MKKLLSVPRLEITARHASITRQNLGMTMLTRQLDARLFVGHLHFSRSVVCFTPLYPYLESK